MPDVTLLGQFHRRRAQEKAAGKRLKRIPKAKRPMYPWPIENKYARTLEDLVNRMEAVAKPIIEKYLPIIFKEAERVRGGQHDDDDGHWITINGSHVFIGKGGVVEKGPAHLMGKTPEEAGKTPAKEPSVKANFGTNKKENVAEAVRVVQAMGYKASSVNPSGRKVNPIHAALTSRGEVFINPSSNFWKDPVGETKRNFESGHLSSSDPEHTLNHEVAHLLFNAPDNFISGHRELVEKEVSKYAGMNPKEFVSEVYAGVKAGHEYNPQIMRIYNNYARKREDAADCECEHLDEWTDDLTAMEDLLRTAYGQLLDEDELEDLVENYAGLASKFNSTDLARVLSVIGGTNLAEELWHEPYVKSFIQQNVKLIKSIGTENHNQIVDIIHRGVRGGLRHEEVAKQIFGKEEWAAGNKTGRFDVSRSKARLIARDQISKFNSDLSKQRLGDAGIKKYYWDTAHDERVRGRPDGIYPKARPSHWAQQGKVYDIDGTGAPGLGHPGQPIQCRCVMVPLFDRFDEEAA